MRILIVEDEPRVAAALKEGLEAEGYEVTLAGTGEDGFFHASARAFDLIVLDIMLRGRDGLEVLSALRRQDNATSVILLTTRDGLKTAYSAPMRGGRLPR
ncbi:MAG: response regulator [Acidobacteriota bacterium]|nr:response regulator [Acidobacteriota bacterium]